MQSFCLWRYVSMNFTSNVESEEMKGNMFLEILKWEKLSQHIHAKQKKKNFTMKCFWETKRFFVSLIHEKVHSSFFNVSFFGCYCSLYGYTATGRNSQRFSNTSNEQYLRCMFTVLYLYLLWNDDNNCSAKHMFRNSLHTHFAQHRIRM